MKSHSYEKIDVGGVSLRCLVSGKKDAPWLVMSHSIATDLHVWDEQVALLADRYRILCFDTRGQGGSDTSPPPYDFPLLVRDVIRLFDHYKIDKACFMGVSLGGMIGYGVALSNPDRLSALIASSSRADAPAGFCTPWDDRIAAIRKAGSMEPLVQPTIDRWFPTGYLSTHPDVAQRIGTMVRETPTTGFEGIARALQKLDYLPHVAKIRVPTLLIAGAKDGTMPEDMRRIHEAITGSEYVIIPDAGHLPNVEQAARFNEAITRFLGTLGL